MAQQFPHSETFIQEINEGPLLPLQGPLAQRIVQTPYSVRFTITEGGHIDPAVELTFTRNNNYTYDMEVTRRPNGALGDYIAGFAEAAIPANEVEQKTSRVYDAYIGMGGGRRRRRRRLASTHRSRHTKKKMSRKRRSLGRR